MIDFPDIALDLGKQFGGMAVTFVAGLTATRLKKEVRLRRFLKSFGKTACDPDHLFICLPLWQVKDAPRDSKRFEKIGPDKKVYSYFGPSQTLSYHDILASQELSFIFEEFYRKPPHIVLDTDRTDMSNKSGLFLGSQIANIKVRQILATIDQPYIEIVEQEETDDHPSAEAIRDKESGKIWDSAGEYEYSVVMRLENPQCPFGYFFLVFGCHSAGTLAAARYLRRQWGVFKKARSNAVVVLRLPRGAPEMARVHRRYGFSKNKTTA